MTSEIQQHYQAQLRQIASAGLLKRERVLVSPQQAKITVAGGRPRLEPVRQQLPGAGG